MIRIAINGFGRIGRLVFRKLFKSKSRSKKRNIEIVALNDLTDTKTLAHLLKHDSAHGKFYWKVEASDDAIIVDGESIKVFSERDAGKLPWEELNVDIVVESTGFYRTKELAKKHLDAGAKKVIISAPAKGDLKTIVYSVNHRTLTEDDKIISAASCTTNALAPIVNVLQKHFGIVKGYMTTVHAYTADQRIQDAPHADLRRARAAAMNIVPTSTGAAIAVGKVLPELNGKLDGIAMRVPVITGSVVDLVVELKDDSVTVEDINNAVKKSTSSALAFSDEPLVSSDVIGETHGSIFDSLMTSELEVDGRKLFKLVFWYDNEFSYVNQFIRTLKYFAKI